MKEKDMKEKAMKEKKIKKPTILEKALNEGVPDDNAGNVGEANGEANEENAINKEEKEQETQAKLVEALNDKYLRLFAEFDNFRKRTDKEKGAMYGEGAKEVLTKLLPVMDNFERALANGDNTDPFYKGVEMIYRQMKDALESLGVAEIPAMGEKFDTNSHEAVMHIDGDEYGENEIIEVLQKGYKYKDKVLRYSMVKVAN